MCAKGDNPEKTLRKEVDIPVSQIVRGPIKRRKVLSTQNKISLGNQGGTQRYDLKVSMRGRKRRMGKSI